VTKQTLQLHTITTKNVQYINQNYLHDLKLATAELTNLLCKHVFHSTPQSHRNFRKHRALTRCLPNHSAVLLHWSTLTVKKQSCC